MSSALPFLMPKLKAFFVHFFITLAVAILSGVLVFYVWYPWPFYELLDGVGLFCWVVACDLVLGPVVSFVVFSNKKSLRSLFLDYLFVAVFQFFGFFVGFYTVVVSRPVFVVFAVDGFDVVSADEVLDSDLEAASRDEWRVRGYSGPKLVWAKIPGDPAIKSQLIFDALNGRDVHRQPKFYAPYPEACAYVLTKGRDVIDSNPEVVKAFAAADRAGSMKGLSAEEVALFPVRSYRATWAVVLRKYDCMPVTWLNVDPY